MFNKGDEEDKALPQTPLMRQDGACGERFCSLTQQEKTLQEKGQWSYLSF